MHKLLSHYFLFLLISALCCHSFSASAASVINAKNKNTSLYLLSDSSSNKNITFSKKNNYIDNYYYLIDFIKPINFIKPIPRSPTKKQLASNKSNPLFNNNLYKQGKKFLVDYEDNDFIQNHLIVFSNTKQYLKETDLMLHNLTNNILLSLQLDSYIQSYHATIQQKKSRTSLLADERLNSNTSKKQDKNAHLQNAEDLSIFTFLRKIFSFQNLFYLFGVTIIYALLKAIIKFLFLQKQKRKKSHRRKQRHA